MRNQELDYERDVQIDPDALDVEWVEQAQLFLNYAEQAAHAMARVDRAKDKVKVVKAEVFLDVRAHPDKYGLEKVTDKAVDAMVESHEDVKAAASELIAFKHESQILDSAVKAFEQRRYSLQNLVQLQGQGYFAAPQEPRDLPQEYGKRAHQRAVRRQVAAASSGKDRSKRGRSRRTR